MAADSVPFKELVNGALQVRETLTRASICLILTEYHRNTSNQAYLGGAGVALSECIGAFAAPDVYRVEQWNRWYGRHCGVWMKVRWKVLQ